MTWDQTSHAEPMQFVGAPRRPLFREPLQALSLFCVTLKVLCTFHDPESTNSSVRTSGLHVTR